MRHRVVPDAVTAPKPGSTAPDHTNAGALHTPRILPLIACVLVLTLLTAGSAHAATPQDRLDAAKNRLSEVRDRLEVVGERCERNEERVTEINTDVESALASVTEVEHAVDRERRAAAAARDHLDELEVQRAAVEDASSSRMVEIYKQGGTDPTLPSLLASVTTEQALARAQVLNVVEHRDRAAIEELAASRTAVAAQREQVKIRERTYDRALGERQQVLDDLEDVRAEYEEKVASCNDTLVELEAQEQIAQEDEEELAAALAEREQESPASVPADVSAGGWAWPAQGPVTSGFGPRWGRLHAGIDIGAPTGAPIHAAKGGVVSYAGVMGGYGNIIVLDHGGGMTTRYAHQSRLGASVGQTVAAGEQIGYIGSTGNSTGPHLHFEVRVNDGPQDPIGYLP